MLSVIALGLGCAGAALGMVLAFAGHRLRRPARIGLIHALLVMGTVGVLATAAATEPVNLPRNAALALFGMALLGGGFNALFRFQGQKPPGFMVLLHALAGLCALTVLAVGVIASG